MSSQVPNPPTPPPDTSSPSPQPPLLLHLHTHTLQTNPSLPPPLAFLTTLHTHLTHTLTNTTSELLSLLSTSTSTLLSSLAPDGPEFTATRGAGELFGRFVVQTLNQGLVTSGGGGDGSKGEDDDFQPLRTHVLESCRVFIERAATSSTRIAQKYASRFLDPANYGGGKVRVATFALDAAITTFLTTAAAKLSPQDVQNDFYEAELGPGFEVAIFTSSHPPATSSITTSLSKHNIPLTHPPLTHLAAALKTTTLLLLPATAILASGAIVGPKGIYTMGIVAKALGVKVFVVGEGWRCCRAFELPSSDLGLISKPKKVQGNEEEKEGGGGKEERDEEREGEEGEEVLPAEYVTGGLIMEEGVFGAGVVGEEVLRMWY